MPSRHLQYLGLLFFGLHVASRHWPSFGGILWYVVLFLGNPENTKAKIFPVLSLRALFARQAQFNRFLSQSPTFTVSRYFRLMALAFTDLMLTVPFGIYEIYSNAAGSEIQPWRGWADAHFNFSRVDQYPAWMWRADPRVRIPLELNRWIVPFCAFVFFAYFGFAEEARRNYVKAFKFATAPFRKLRFQSNSEKLPDHVADKSVVIARFYKFVLINSH